MNILAQHGFGPKDKLESGVASGVITGAILSPRYLTPEKMADQVHRLRETGSRVLMDPEFFATAFLRHPQPNLGALEQWDYFRASRRAALISGAAIPEVIGSTITEQARLGLSEWIAPNVYMGDANSIDAAIALNFLGRTKSVARKVGNAPVFATLAVDRDAIMNDGEFREILDAVTAIEDPPDGYYVLLGSGAVREAGNQVRSDIFHPQVIAGWMYLNHVLSINGARVINGYCHLLAPLLAVCGGEAAASGWFSGLRQFSMGKYAREAGGGRFPLIRYVSAPLLAHVKQNALDTFRAVVPEVATGGRLDAAYADREPSRTEEALQSWEALSLLCEGAHSGDLAADLVRYKGRVARAFDMWSRLQGAGFSEEVEPNIERLEAVRDGISLFEKWAELA